jgi:hypothetical protein
MALDAQILLSILAHETSSGDISQTLRVTPATYSLALSDGTGDNQAQVVWSDSGVATSGGVAISLVSVADTAVGSPRTIQFTGVKCIYVRNKGSLGIAVTSSGMAGFPSSGLNVLRGGAVVLAAPSTDGYAPSGLGYSLTLTGQDVPYDIILIGEGTVT